MEKTENKVEQIKRPHAKLKPVKRLLVREDGFLHQA
jgi:hypothetical protein